MSGWTGFRKRNRTPVGWVRSFLPHIPPTGRDCVSTATRTSASVRPLRADRTLSAKRRLRMLRRCGNGRGAGSVGCRAGSARPRHLAYQGDPTPPQYICGSFREPPHQMPPLLWKRPAPSIKIWRWAFLFPQGIDQRRMTGVLPVFLPKLLVAVRPKPPVGGVTEPEPMPAASPNTSIQ